MPSPTRATMVSSVAPPTKLARLVRTVTRPRALMTMPSLATASMLRLLPPAGGQSMTCGLTEVCTASTTFLLVPLVARSMAHAWSNTRSMLAFCALISDWITISTWPPARKCVERSSIVTGIPDFTAVIRGSTILRIGIFRSCNWINSMNVTLAPET